MQIQLKKIKTKFPGECRECDLWMEKGFEAYEEITTQFVSFDSNQTTTKSRTICDYCAEKLYPEKINFVKPDNQLGMFDDF